MRRRFSSARLFGVSSLLLLGLLLPSTGAFGITPEPPVTYALGDLSLQNGWDGGITGQGFTNNNANSNVVTDSAAFDGTQSWRYSGSYNSPGSGTPFTPYVASVGAPNAASVFGGGMNSPVTPSGDESVISFAFKAVAPGDGSRINIYEGNRDAVDPARTGPNVYLETLNANDVRIYNFHLSSTDQCANQDFPQSTIATVAAGQWHTVKMTTTYPDVVPANLSTYGTTTYVIDEGTGNEITVVDSNAVWVHQFNYCNSGQYSPGTAIKWANSFNDYPTHQGFYIDDVAMRVVDTDTDTTIANFATGFESAGPRYVATTGSDASNACVSSSSPCATIQHAVNQAVAGDTINVAAGTYYENVVVNKKVNIDGAGDGNTAGDTIIDASQSPANNGLSTLDFAAGGTADNDRVTVSDVRITGSLQRGVSYGANVGYVTLLHVTLDNTVRGIEFQSTGVNNLVLDDVTISNNSATGIRAATAAGVSDLIIRNSDISNNNMGAAIFATSASTSNEDLFTAITIEDTTITNNLQKGLYFEKLDNAVLQRLTITDNGTDATYAFNNGIDLNLKHGTFAGIQILDSTFDGSGILTTLNGGNDFSAALALKARSDAPSYSANPATLTDVTVANNFFIDSTTDVRVGEPTKSNPGPTDVHINGNSLLAGIENVSTASVDASANWWGSDDESTVAASATGSDVDFTPFLESGTDTDVATGFQGDFSYLNVTSLGSQTGTTGRIQEAVDLVDGSTVNVLDGTYDEQVVIDESLTLQGQGDNTIIAPSSDAKLTSIYTTGTQAGANFNGMKIASVIDVHGVGVDGVTITNLKVDAEDVNALPAGADWVSGISYGETGGTIDDVTVEDTKFVSPASVRTYGIWIDAVGNTALSVDVTDSTVAQYGRNGVNGRGDDLTLDITGNTITGPGMVGPAQVPNGVLLIAGTVGTVSTNTITANHYTGTSWLASGILLFQAGDNIQVTDNDISDSDDAVILNATDLATVSGNDLSNNAKGVRVEAGSAANNLITNNTIDNNSLFGIELSNTVGTGNTAFRNSISGNATGVSNLSTNLFDAECNWWGAADGPSGEGPGAGDSVSTVVDFEPWLESATLTGSCTGVPVCASAPFTDVPVDHPFCAEIQWIKDQNISLGFDDGTYRPTLDVTRQAMSAFLARLAGATLTACATPPFTDVPVDHPFCEEIQWMKDEGISTGFGDGTYRPALDVTRQAMSAFLARLADATLTPCTTPPFTDVAITHPFCAEIQWMKENGISTGFDDGTYRPSIDVTRQAMAAFLVRVSPLLT